MATRETLEKMNNFCLVTLTGIALTGALIYTKPVLVPFVLSLFIFIAMLPLVDWLGERTKVPRIMAIGASFALIFSVFFICILMIGFSLESFAQGAAVYKAKMISVVTQGSEIASWFGIELNSETIRKELSQLPFISWAKQITGGLVAFVSNAVLIGVFLLFLLLGSSKQNAAKGFIGEIQTKVSKYVVVKLSTSVITGVLVGGILWVFQVELAFMFAILTVLLNFIPSIGSIIATLLPLPILILQFGGSVTVLAVVLLLGVIQFGIGNVMEPKIMGENMDLHPVAVLVFLIFWGLVWGIPGMFMAVPITAILKIVLSRISTTKFLAEILAGRIGQGV